MNEAPCMNKYYDMIREDTNCKQILNNLHTNKMKLNNDSNTVIGIDSCNKNVLLINNNSCYNISFI